MKFDGNQAWKRASAMVAANRELLLALGGVFFFLPSLALIMLFKQPKVPPGATAEQMVPVLQAFLTTMAPWFLLGSAIQAVGQLTLIGLFGHGRRSTVGEALRRGLASLPSFLAVQLISGFVMMSVLTLAMSAGSLVTPLLGAALGFYLMVQIYARLIAAGPVIVVERRLNPFAALGRAIRLSRGNGLRIGNFLFLLALGAFLLLSVLSIVVGIIAAVTIGAGRTADMLTGFVSSAASAVALTYFVAVIVAIHGQLVGDAPEAVGGPFD